MATFLFTYRGQPGAAQALDALDDSARQARLDTWYAWFGSLGSHVLDMGQPVSAARSLGESGGGTEIGGYSLVTADSLDAAVALTEGCPALQNGGGIEVAELRAIPDRGKAVSAAPQSAAAS